MADLLDTLREIRDKAESLSNDADNLHDSCSNMENSPVEDLLSAIYDAEGNSRWLYTDAYALYNNLVSLVDDLEDMEGDDGYLPRHG